MTAGLPEVTALTVNGEPVTLDVPVGTTLGEALRDNLGLPGTKLACWENVCGACTVLIDGAAVASCSRLLHDAAGQDVWTVEGADRHPVARVVRRAFEQCRAYQCGFCTAGFIMATTALLAEPHGLSDEQLPSALDGNVCRCGAYSDRKSVV